MCAAARRYEAAAARRRMAAAGGAADAAEAAAAEEEAAAAAEEEAVAAAAATTVGETTDGGESEQVPAALAAYARTQLSYETLEQQRSALEAELSVRPAGERVEVPQLHWDTSLLDVEEDKVIWCASELGKDAIMSP